MPKERRRTRYDIYADIIEIIARKGVCSLTRVSYGSNLPVDRAKKTLEFLVSHGFIRE
ncbi:MAG: transcriptional regulator, partial [Candidatus Korarchaeota archaeon]|nr:transcriptional regulator [Candidatus Korarchaeota archaeon]NIU83889.1 transcriptional regulator [Candidatus Thorarchaeota archaeon]NIW52129.1 transcriptional regulator [Candidatus Korarchaeota archaeon]